MRSASVPRSRRFSDFRIIPQPSSNSSSKILSTQPPTSRVLPSQGPRIPSGRPSLYHHLSANSSKNLTQQ